MKIRLMNDPILHTPTTPVSRDELDYVKSLVPDMVQAMNNEGGAGLAANQVGIAKRFFILKEGDGSILFINPEIVSMNAKVEFQEGCLSIPGTSATTMRASELRLKYLDENFNEVEQDYREFVAAAIQHEVDHLDGKLYVDQLPPMKRSLVIKKHHKFMRMKGRQ